jgi:hypothetical protein
MKRIRSSLFALPLALLLGAAAASAPVLAGDEISDYVWNPVKTWQDKDGRSHTSFVDANDPKHWLSIAVDYDGSLAYVAGHDSDPGPDGTTQRIDKPDVAGMLKKAKGLTIHISASVKEGTPLAGWLESEGRGGSIRWNPADDSDTGGPGQAPKGHTDGPTPKQLAAITKNINFVAKSLATIGGSMGDGVDGLAGESAPTPNKSGGRGKGTSDGTGGGSDNKNKWRHGGEVVTLGPRPDLVNPAPKNRTRSSGPAIFRAPIRSGVPGANLR